MINEEVRFKTESNFMKHLVEALGISTHEVTEGVLSLLNWDISEQGQKKVILPATSEVRYF